MGSADADAVNRPTAEMSPDGRTETGRVAAAVNGVSRRRVHSHDADTRVREITRARTLLPFTFQMTALFQ